MFQFYIFISDFFNSGRVVRSKPVVKRITATCVESIFKYRYGLQGNIVDERNGNHLYKNCFISCLCS